MKMSNKTKEYDSYLISKHMQFIEYKYLEKTFQIIDSTQFSIR